MTGSATNRVIKEGLCEEIFEQSSKGSEGASHVGIWQKRIPGRENSKSSEAGMHPTNCGTAKGMAWLEPRVKGTTGKTKNLIRQGLVGH